MLLANLPGMAYRCNYDAHFSMHFVSDGALELTGHTPKALLAQPESYSGLIHAEDQNGIRANVQAAIDTGDRYSLTYRIIDANGIEKWVLDRGSDVEASSRTSRILEGFVTDITERVATHKLIERRLRALTRIAASQTFDQPLETTLDTLANGVVEVTKAVACVVALIDDEQGLYRVVGIHGMPAGYAVAVEGAYAAGASLSSITAYRTRRPVLRTLHEFMINDHLQAEVYRIVRDAAWNTIASVPLIYHDRALGSMSCSYPIGMEPGDEEIDFLQVIADQAAVAVQTARLFADVQGKAALEERQRLARELHDSVSQALFGIGLGARTARTLLDRDPLKAAEPLDFVIALAETGLTEMRALIFELRPDALESEDLVRLLEQQAAAVRARHRLLVETDLGTEPALFLKVKEMLYRIAQEALHTTTKHAQARTVTISLHQRPDGIMLVVEDDGVGFDPDGSFPGHLGLRSIRERANLHGATVEMESSPGRGARVRVFVPSPQ